MFERKLLCNIMMRALSDRSKLLFLCEDQLTFKSWLWWDKMKLKQALNLERCALKAEKLQHGKLKNLYTDLSPCGKRNAEKTSIWLSAYFA